MASYTSIYGSAKSDAGYTWQLRLDYTITPDEENNSSELVCALYLYHGSAGGYNLNSKDAYYVIDGTKTYKTYDFRDVDPKWTKLGSKTFTVAHNVDGTKSYTLTASWVSANETYWTPASISISETIELPRINRGLARINVDGEWKRAIPWVNVDGTWKRAMARVNVDGTWKMCT